MCARTDYHHVPNLHESRKLRQGTIYLNSHVVHHVIHNDSAIESFIVSWIQPGEAPPFHSLIYLLYSTTHSLSPSYPLPLSYSSNVVCLAATHAMHVTIQARTVLI